MTDPRVDPAAVQAEHREALDAARPEWSAAPAWAGYAFGMDEPIWCLRIMLRNDSVTTVFGTRGALEPVWRKWVDREHVDGSRIVAEGFMDDAARSPIMAAHDPDDVIGVILWRQ